MIDGVIPSGQGMAEPFEIAGRFQPRDADEYLPMLAEYDLTEDQARELLTVLWSIMRSMVELGLSLDVCGQFGLNADPVLSNSAAPLVSSDHPS